VRRTTDLTKSALVDRMAARNPHLYARDVESIVDEILNTTSNALIDGDRSKSGVELHQGD
jgi:integration host factor subunit beta